MTGKDITDAWGMRLVNTGSNNEIVEFNVANDFTANITAISEKLDAFGIELRKDSRGQLKFFIGGNLTGDISVTAGADAYGITVDQWGNGVYSELVVKGNVSGNISVNAYGEAEGISALGTTDSLISIGDLSGKLFVKSQANTAHGLYSSGKIVMGDFSGEISASGRDTVVGISGISLAVNGDMSGKISVQSTNNNTNIHALSLDKLSVGGDFSVEISSGNQEYDGYYNYICNVREFNVAGNVNSNISGELYSTREYNLAGYNVETNSAIVYNVAGNFGGEIKVSGKNKTDTWGIRLVNNSSNNVNIEFNVKKDFIADINVSSEKLVAYGIELRKYRYGNIIFNVDGNFAGNIKAVSIASTALGIYLEESSSNVNGIFSVKEKFSGDIYSESNSGKVAGIWVEGGDAVVSIKEFSGSITAKNNSQNNYVYGIEAGKINGGYKEVVTKEAEYAEDGTLVSEAVTESQEQAMIVSGKIDVSGGTDTYGIYGKNVNLAVTKEASFDVKSNSGKATAIYASGTLTLDSLAGEINTITESKNTAYGIYSSGKIEIDNLSGSISVSGQKNSYGIKVYNLSSNVTLVQNIGDLSGNIDVYSQAEEAIGINMHCNGGYSSIKANTYIDNFTGSITATAHNAAQAIRVDRLDITGDFTGILHAVSFGDNADFAAGLAINTGGMSGYFTGGLTMNDMAGEIYSQNLAGRTYGIYANSDYSLDFAIGLVSGSITVVGNESYGVYSSDKINGGYIDVVVKEAEYAEDGTLVSEAVTEKQEQAMIISGTVLADGQTAYGINAGKYMNVNIDGILAAGNFESNGDESKLATLQNQLENFSASQWYAANLISAAKGQYAISSGSGNDGVTVSDGGLVFGNIALGGGTNTLTVSSGAEIHGDITANSLNLIFTVDTVPSNDPVITADVAGALIGANTSYIIELADGSQNGRYVLAAADDLSALADKTFTVNYLGNAYTLTAEDDFEDNPFVDINIVNGKELELIVSNTFFVYNHNIANDMIGSERNDSVTVSFSKVLDADSFELDMVSLTDKNGKNIVITSYEINGNKLTLNYDPITEEGTYTLKLSERIKNIDGIFLDQNLNQITGEADDSYTLDLTADFTAPKVLKVTPDTDFAGTLTTLQITFSSAIDFASLKDQITLVTPSGKTITPASYKQITGSCVEVTVPEQTAYGEYQLKVGSQIMDLAGNKLDQNNDGVFGGEDDIYTGKFSITEIDLKVADVTLNKTTFAPGEKVVINWNTFNNGGYALSGSWTDGIYLSTDTRWDINDIKLGELVHNGGLAKDQQLANTLDVSLAGVTAGNYYILVRSDIYMQEKGDKESALAAQNLQAVGITVALPDLTVDTPVTGSISKSGDYCVYKLTQNVNEALELVLDSNIDRTNMEIYVGNGYIPTRENYDSKVQKLTDGKLVLNAPDTEQELYVMVYNKSTNAAFDYTLTAQSIPMSITGIIGTTQGNRNGSVFELTGVDFAPDMVVSLTDSNGNTVNADKVTFIDNTKVKVEFSAGTLAVGTYSITASVNGENASYDENVTITAESGGKLEFNVKVPDSVGRHLMAEIVVECTNTGFDAMDSVLIFMSPTQSHASGPDTTGAILTLDKNKLTNGFWTATMPDGYSTSVSFFTSGQSTGLIMPGEKVSTTVYYNGWLEGDWDFGNSHINWNVSYIDANNTNTIDWKTHLLDNGKEEKIAAVIAENLETSIGTTWGDYVKMLSRNMRYLYENNISTDNVSVDDLFVMEYRWAAGKITYTPELSLNTDNSFSIGEFTLDLERNYYSDFDSRLQISSFGNGWTCSWDMYLDIAENGDITFVDGEKERLFQPDVRRGYITVANDGSEIKQLKDGTYKLAEANGEYRIFDSNGLLQSITTADNKKITFEYNNGKLCRIVSGNEIRTITRNESGFITAVTDQNGNTQTYIYDNSGNLLSVTDGTGKVTDYTYDTEHFNALSSVVSGTVNNKYVYDTTGRLTEVSENGHTYKYDYGTTGMVSVSVDGKFVGSNYYGIDGELVKTVASDQLTKGNIVYGTLTDSNGNILAGITVDAITENKIYTAVTDENGVYYFTGLSDNWVNFVIQDAQYKTLNQIENISGIEFTSMTVETAKNSISGTYSYVDDAMADASIILTNITTGEYTVVRGYAGKFAAYDLAVGEYTMQISAGDSATYYDTFSVTEDSPYQTLGNYDLKVGGNIAYTLTSDSSLKNTVVQLIDKAGNIVAGEVLSQGGTYTFENIAAGDYTLSISSPLGSSFNVSREITVETLKNTETNIVLDDGVAITGTLTDANGNAHKGMYLELANGESSSLVHTDCYGNYSFENLAAGEYTLSIYGSNTPLKTFTVNAGDADITYNHTTEYFASWSGHLIDSEGMTATGIVSLYLDGEYLDSVYAADGYFRFDMKKEGNYSIVAEGENGFFTQVEAADIVSGSELNSEFTLGTYTLTINPSNVPAGEITYILSQLDAEGKVISTDYTTATEFTGLTDGSYKLTAYKGNYKAESTFEVSGSSTQELAFEKLNELKIQLAEIEEALNVLLYNANGEIVDSLYIDESGTYTFKALEAADYKLVAFSDNYNAMQNITVNADTGTVELELAESTRTVSGTVTVDGQAVEGVRVSVYDKNYRLIGKAVSDINGKYSVKVQNGEIGSVKFYADAAYTFIENADIFNQTNVTCDADLNAKDTVATHLWQTPEFTINYSNLVEFDYYIYWPERNSFASSLNFYYDSYFDLTPAHIMTKHTTEDGGECKLDYDSYANAQLNLTKQFWDCHDEFKSLNAQIDEYKFSVLTAATGVGKGILKTAELFGWKLPKLFSKICTLWAKIGDKLGPAIDLGAAVVSFIDLAKTIYEKGNILNSVFNTVSNSILAIDSWDGFTRLYVIADDCRNQLLKNFSEIDDALKSITKIRLVDLDKFEFADDILKLTTEISDIAVDVVSATAEILAPILSLFDLGGRFYSISSQIVILRDKIDTFSSSVYHLENLHWELPECPCGDSDDKEDISGGPDTKGYGIDSGTSEKSNSHDPNDKTVQEGYGEQKYITGNEVLNYKIEFENDPEFATAPARWIRVYDTLAPEYDLDTFQLKSIWIAGNYIELEAGRDSFNQLVELNIMGEKILTQININLDYDTREIFAEFMAVDRETGFMIQDVDKGILFPNDDNGCGEGYFTYSIELKEGLAHGTEVRNKADIYFDFNEVIETPETLNTVDNKTPEINSFSAIFDGGNQVTFYIDGNDADSGIKLYNISYSTDGESYNYFTTVTENSWIWEVDLQTEYFFKAQAVDNAGNISEWSEEITIIQEDFVLPVNYSAGNFESIDFAGATGTLYISNDDFAAYFAVELSNGRVDITGFGQTGYQWQFVNSNGNIIDSGTFEGNSAAAAEAFISERNGNQDIFIAQSSGKWAKGYIARHNGNLVNKWSGTQEQIALTGKNKIEDIFIGSIDSNILLLTDDANGDALFLDDIYTNGVTQSRISGIDKIIAGTGDDVIDFTSSRYAYVGTAMEVYGGNGNDTIWIASGKNTLFGDAGNDRLIGGANNDVIVGGIGNDRMHGGGGEDIFCFGENWGNDTVEQLAGGKITLWFESGSESSWNADTLTYTDGTNSVKVSGISADNISLIFGDDGSLRYDELADSGCFEDTASEKIFDNKVLIA